jgi:hypothetical protein
MSSKWMKRSSSMNQRGWLSMIKTALQELHLEFKVKKMKMEREKTQILKVESQF